MRRKRLLLATLLAAMTLLVGACAQEGEDTGDVTDDDGTQAAACSTDNLQALGTAPSAKDFKLASLTRRAPRTLAQAKPTVKLGFIGDITGENSGLVVSAHNSAMLAIKQANEGGDLPVTLELVSLDNKDGGEDTAPALAQRLIGDDDVVGVIGPAFSGETKTTGELFQEAGLTNISQSATNPDLTKNGWKTFFRALSTDAVQGGQTGPLIVDVMGCESVAVINDKSEYGAGLAEAVTASIEEAGGEVVLEEGIEPTTDYTAVIDSVIAEDPEVLYYSGYDAQAPLVAKQYREKGGEGIFVGGDGDKGTNFLKEGGEDVEGAVLTCPCLDPNASDDPRAQEFAKAYMDEYDEEAGIYSTEAWDVTHIFIAAIMDAGEDVTRESVLDFVTNLKDYEGLSKPFNWTEEHEVVGGEITFVYLVADGKYTLAGRVDELLEKNGE